MPIVSAIFLALAAGVITAIPGIFSELGEKIPKNIPLLVDVKTFWGKRLTRGEVFWFGMLIHLLMAALFGAMYEYLVLNGMVRPYLLSNLLVFAFCYYLFIGFIVFPLVELGLFGRKEGKTVWLELLVTNFLVGFIIWLLIYLFPYLKP
jgi:hypothetical protein